MGQYDTVLVLDSPDDASATARLMSLGKLGKVRAQTLRAFTAAELDPISDKVLGLIARPDNPPAGLS
jgi:uncharacterized protein with GYD domain